MRAEEDDAPEAARDWLADLQELLLTGGYFRARIAALAPFDKARAHGPAACARNPLSSLRRGRGAPRSRACTQHACPALCWPHSPLSRLHSLASPPALTPLPYLRQVIGGLAWSITASNVDVEVDLLYDEDASLGQKLRLSEAIERALRRMNCPAPLLAHQIQGLDYPALFPVVQWLVKRVLATREEFGDRLRAFALHSYRRAGYPPLADAAATTDPAAPGRLRARFGATRQLRRAPGAPPPPDRAAAVRWALAEYGHRFTAGAAALAPQAAPAAAGARGAAAALAGMSLGGGGGGEGGDADGDADMEAALAAVGDGDGALSGSAAARLVALRGAEVAAAAAAAAQAEDPGGVGARTAALERQLAAAQRAATAEAARADEAAATAAAAVSAAVTAAEARDAVLAHNARCEAETAALDAQLAAGMGGGDAAASAAAASRVMAALRDVASLKAAEAAFKQACRRQLGELQAAAAAVGDDADAEAAADAADPAEAERCAAVAAAHASDSARLDAARAGASQRALGVALLQRRLAELPARPELAQYERRFVELADCVADKLAATRRYFDMYNAAADALRLAQNETALLNRARDQYDAVRTADAASRAAYAQQLGTVAAGVAERAARAEEKAAAQRAALAAAQDSHAAALQRQRDYFAAVKRFQDACARGEELRRALAASGLA